MRTPTQRLAVEVPPKMRLLDRDRRGYPVPWIVQRDLTGRPFFVMNDMERTMACGRRKVCGICGAKLERDVWLIGGPGAAFHEHGAYLDPPMHRQCATYALQVCPYIGARYSGRADLALVKHGKWHPAQRVLTDETMIPEQPPFFVLARTGAARMIVEDKAPRFLPRRPWLAVELWRWGEQITEAEAVAQLAANERWPWTPGDLIHWQASAEPAPK
jgi:hypothetical protein